MNPTQKRTVTIMTYCDESTGKHSYSVYQGPSYLTKKHGRVFYSHRAKRVAVYNLSRNEKPDYETMTAKHATVDAPAIEWQVKKDSEAAKKIPLPDLNITLKEIINLTRRVELEVDDPSVKRLCELILYLNTRLESGDSFPDNWNKNRMYIE